MCVCMYISIYTVLGDDLPACRHPVPCHTLCMYIDLRLHSGLSQIYLYIYICIYTDLGDDLPACRRPVPCHTLCMYIYIGLRLHSRPGQISLYLYIHILVMTFPLVGARSRATPYKLPSSPQEAIPPANRKKVNEETFCQREFMLF